MIKLYPQYHLYLLTKKLMLNREKINPKGANDTRSIDATIINRAYMVSRAIS